jgi:hypothetical protein
MPDETLKAAPVASEISPTIDSNKYYGSPLWVQQVLKRITIPKTMELLGLPGMGKTSLLRFIASSKGALANEQYKSLLPGPYDKEPERIFLLLVEFKLMPKDKQWFTYLYERFQAEYPKLRERTRKHFPSLGRELDLPEIKTDPLTTEDETLSTLESYLKRLEHIRVVFLFDDFDHIFKDFDLPQITRLRPWVEWSCFVLAISRRLDEVNEKAAASPFFSSMPCVRLNGLGAEEASELVTDLLRSTNTAFHPDDVEFILGQAGGHTELLIRATQAFWMARQQMTTTNNEDPLSKDHREHLVTMLCPEFYRFFNLYWTCLDEAERDVLKKITLKQKREGLTEKAAEGTLQNSGLLLYDAAARENKPFSPLFKDFLADQVAALGKSKPDLTGTEASLLEYLQRHANQPCTFEQLLQEVWKASDQESDEKDQRRRMQVTVSRLRTKLNKANTGEDIVNIRDVGYRYIPAANE